MEANGSSLPDVRNRGVGPRHSILDLAPLELECMSALWPMGEGTVRDILQELCQTRRRAYTTVLTIMDRLTQKGIVTRHKVGRAFLYRANLSVDEARGKAVEQIVAGFFSGSRAALAAHLAAHGGDSRPFPPAESASVDVLDSSVDVPNSIDRESKPRNFDETLL